MMKKKSVKAKSTPKKSSKKSAKKSAKKPAAKMAVKVVARPVLYIHSTHSGPQLCLKTSPKKADGVILPAAQQKELNGLYAEWEKVDGSTDFMKFPKAAKWMKKLLASFSFSAIE